MKVKIGDLTNIRTGKLDANASSEDGQYPFFTCSKDPLKISTYTYDCECVLVAGNGDLNVKYYKGKFDAYQRTYIIEDNGNGRLYMPYLYYFMTRYVEQLRKQAIGGVIKYIKLGNLTNAEMELPTIEEQKIIVNIMEKAKHILDMKNQNIHNLNQLIQSRFVEMFGDLADPKCVWNKVKLINVCKTPNDVKCGPFGTQLNKNEYQKKGVAVWEIPQINDEFASEPIHFLTEKKAKILESYSVISGDIVMSRKGNIGKCAVFPDEYEKGIIHSDVLRIRVDAEQVNSQFMMRQLHYSRAIKHQIGTVSSGAIMAGINVTKLKQIYVHIPPIDLQNQFAAFIHQVNKSKFAIIKFLYCFIDNKQSIIKPRPNTKESGKIRGGKPHADEF